MAIKRDHFEGTEFDMTQGPRSVSEGECPPPTLPCTLFSYTDSFVSLTTSGQAWGNPNRYDRAASDMNDLTQVEVDSGHFERPISMFRTIYSSVAVSRPTPGLGMAWVAQHAPHGAPFLPLYVESTRVPQSYAVGSRTRFNTASQFWVNLAVTNWAERQ